LDIETESMSCSTAFSNPKSGVTLFRNILGTMVLVLALTGCAGTPDATPPHPDMVQIPEGVFMMGMEIENDHYWGDTDEERVHEVYLDTFWIDRYEVTAKDFAEFLNHHPGQSRRYLETGNAVTVEYVDGRYRARSGLERWPVNRVSWYGADAYCREQDKRLPTEAEWEKAAKGTDARPFPWGSTYPSNDLATFRRPFAHYGFDAMKPVDSMPAGRSPYGVHHMAGNVWEWVSDWYDPAYYDDSPRENPQGPESATLSTSAPASLADASSAFKSMSVLPPFLGEPINPKILTIMYLLYSLNTGAAGQVLTLRSTSEDTRYYWTIASSICKIHMIRFTNIFTPIT